MSKVQVDKVVNLSDDGAPQLTYGAELPVGYGLTGAGGLNISGVVTAASAVFSGNVTIGGTLTYEDVTNIDVVGVSTFAGRMNVNSSALFNEGLSVTAGVTTIAGAATLAQLTTVSSQLNIGSNIKAGSAGVVTATSFVGSGANLTGIPALTGSTNNEVVTVTGANAIQGETKLTFSGALLEFAINNNDQGFKISATGNHIPDFIFDANRTAANDNLGRIQYYWNGTEVAEIAGIAGDDTTNKDDGQIKFQTRPSGGSLTERLRLDSSGRLMLGTTTEGDSSADDLTIATTGNSGITIRSGTSSSGNLYFSDGTSGTAEYAGMVQYQHNNNALVFRSNATTALTIDSSQNATFAGDIDVSGDANIGATSASNLIGSQYSDLLVDVGNNNNYIHFRKNLGQNEPLLNITHNQDYMAALRYANSGNAWACGLKTDGSYFISSEMGANGGGGTDRFVLTTSSATFAGTVSDSKGNLRSIPIQSNSGSHTLAAASAGKVLYTDANTNVNDSVFSAGDVVTIINNSGSNQTITQGSGVTLYDTGDDGSTGNKTLKPRGMATIWFASASVAYISGNF